MPTIWKAFFQRDNYILDIAVFNINLRLNESHKVYARSEISNLSSEVWLYKGMYCKGIEAVAKGIYEVR